ncbi:unnamed protein product [Lactuca virosa]|uniref:Ribosome biogenesis protein NOP53 n=1 Tax=Lactuca virosa TaxID=75947 RepID=A0AAU9M0K0_9ASTR|nr:unnamed protein product [Lactuca virosa]
MFKDQTPKVKFLKTNMQTRKACFQQTPCVLPLQEKEIPQLPDLNLKQKVEEFRSLVSSADNLKKLWNSSPYHLEDPSEGGKKNGSIIRRPPLPAELVGKNVRPMKKKKTQWDLQSGLQRLDLFENMKRN